MAGSQPFTPVIGSVLGKSLAINIASTNQGTITSTTAAMATNLLVTNTNNSVTMFVRMSTEAAPVATSLDIPIAPATSRIFGNPAPAGVTGIGVTATITGGTASGIVVFTPGNQGVE